MRHKYEQESILILCEGETELNYLKLFLKSNKIELRKAKLTNAQQLVKEATHSRVSGFDKIYCIFDRDPSSNSFIQLKDISDIFKQNSKLIGIHSNPCFEIWTLLHLKYTDKQYNDYKDLEKDLNQELPKHGYKKEYKKGKEDMKKMLVKIYQPNQEQAIQNAEAILKNLKDKNGNPINQDNWFIIEDSYTEIHKLFEPDHQILE